MRDFFYNKNDVFVAVVIILIAAFVIYMRVGVIMDYPSRAAGEEKKTFMESLLWIDKDNNIFSSINFDFGKSDTEQPPAATTPPAQAEVAPAVTEPAPTPEPVTPIEEVPVEPAVTDPPAETAPVDTTPAEIAPAETTTEPETTQPVSPSTEITITVVAGDVGSTIGDKLVSAGVITDKAAFLKEVDAQNAATKLKQGTFKIPAGSSLADIVKILVG